MANLCFSNMDAHVSVPAQTENPLCPYPCKRIAAASVPHVPIHAQPSSTSCPHQFKPQKPNRNQAIISTELALCPESRISPKTTY